MIVPPDQGHKAKSVKSEDGAALPSPSRPGKQVLACTGKDPLWHPGTKRADAADRISELVPQHVIGGNTAKLI